MCAAGPALRLLVTIVQIAALLAFALSAPLHAGEAQAHADRAHRSGDCAGHHGAATADPDAAMQAASRVVTHVLPDAAQDGAPSPCIHACCHHVFASPPEGPVQPGRRVRAIGPSPEPAAAYAGVSPETLPEPPRTHA